MANADIQRCINIAREEAQRCRREAEARELHTYSLDIDYHKRKYFREGRLFSDPDQHEESDFTAQYRAAVWAARNQKFEGDR